MKIKKLFCKLNLFLLFYIFININIFSYFKRLLKKRKMSYNNRKLVNEEKKLNNIINIYYPNNTVYYISSAINEEGDLFITTNTVNNSIIRLIYALKKDGTNFFEEPYKIMQVNLSANNTYPLLTFLYINKYEYLISFSVQGQYEVFDFYNNNIYYLYSYQLSQYNSEVNKNTFVHLKYYNNSKYILNAYINRKLENQRFILQKLSYKKYNITNKNNIEKEELVLEISYKNSSVSCFEISSFIECLYVNQDLLYSIMVFNISKFESLYNITIATDSIKNDFLFSKCIYIKKNIGAFLYFIQNNCCKLLKLHDE